MVNVRKLFLLVGAIGLWMMTGMQAEQGKVPTLSAQDYADIQLLYANYPHGFDSKVDDGGLYLSVFTDTATFTDQRDRVASGRAGLDERYAHSQTGKPNPISIGHSTWNILVDPAPWGAVGRSYTGGGRFNTPGTPASTGLVGEYVDVIVKTAQGWRFQQRMFREHFIRTATPQREQTPAPSAANTR
jgi:hypothetical protein